MPTMSRRRVLAGLAVVGAGCAGAAIGAGLTRPAERDRPVTRTVPAPLAGALAREQALLGQLRAVAANPDLAAVVAPLVADHAAHEQALRGLVSTYLAPSSASPSTSAPPAPTARRDALAAAERSAAAAAAAESAALRGPAAALLASISASEAAHAAWLR